MPDYDLSGLSSRSFEKLVQSLAIKILGPGVTVFGDGPDGGREATYEGRMNYPSAAEPWDGYCVVQAKFRQRPQGAPDDGDWALKELEKELKKFSDPDRTLRKPDYYIFATNVVLTPAHKTGSKDKAAALFKQYDDRLPFRGHAVWDYDQISGFLDDNEAIRHAYAAWVTPGDVLSEVLDWFKASRTDFGEVIANFLAKEFAADQFACLTQAGHTADERLPLASVFIDLPVSTERMSEPPQEDSDQQNDGFAGRIVEAAKDRFAPDSGVNEAGPFLTQFPDYTEHGPAPGRFVLIGGPGQGKTTVSQLICQLFRAALLRNRDPSSLAAPVRDALGDFLTSCDAHKIPLPTSRRFPLRVVLNEFAAELSTAKPEDQPSLLSYFVARIAKRTDRTISPDDFREWLRTYPFILILDGLDEVPATSNRDQVLQKIEEFWTDAAQCNADVLTIATTRPQGYNDDFSPQYYEHLWLTPLSETRALTYAERLARSKFGDDDTERDRVLAGLRQAASQEITARLMRSPLQVTIMFILVEHGGTPPRDRWRLFNDYYQTIYRREKQRQIPAASLLQDREKNIEVIHTRVALLLQMKSESTGGTEAMLPRGRFAQVVKDHLEEEGVEGDELERLTQQIIEAAEQRLVFLVEVQEGQIGFEIPSLREFMAAQALFEGEGTQEEVHRRLETIASVAHWRNVFLFGAGRCFAEHIRRDPICTICEKLNNGDVGGAVAKQIRAGSLLALDILENGMAQQAPNYLKLLADRALGLLDLPPSSLHERLAGQYDDRLESTFVEQIKKRLAQTEFAAQLGAWMTLLSIEPRGIQWAEEMIDANWPTEPDRVRELLFSPDRRIIGPRLLERIKEWLPRADPHDIIDSGGLGIPIEMISSSLVPAFKSLEVHTTRGQLEVGLRLHRDESGDKFRFDYKRLSWDSPTIEALVSGKVQLEHPGWIPLIEAARFASSPSNTALGCWLDTVRSRGALHTAKRFVRRLPWPLAACADAASTADDLDDLARRARNGDLGDYGDWVAAEERWEQHGITDKDFQQMVNRDLPFSAEIAIQGFPMYPDVGYSIRSPGAEDELLDLVVIYEQLPQCDVRTLLAEHLSFAVVANPSCRALMLSSRSASTLRVLFTEAGRFWLDGSFIDALFETYETNGEFWGLLDTLGRMNYPRALKALVSERIEALVEHLRKHPNHLGVLRLVAMHVSDKPCAALQQVVPDIVESDEPHLRQAALVVRLAQGVCQVEDVSQLADVTRQLAAEQSDTIESVTRVISNNTLFDSATESYLLKLLSHAENYSLRDRARIIDLLHDCFRRRQSELAQPQRWRELALPERLIPLLPVST